MPLPPHNVTDQGGGLTGSGDVYRFGNAPPAAPDVAGIQILLMPWYSHSHEAAITSSTTNRWTHIAVVPTGTDIRDGYQGEANPMVNPDTVYIPDKNGTPFKVVFVERTGYGTSADALRVYLQRQAPPWPTVNL